jgi:hypothetical protein
LRSLVKAVAARAGVLHAQKVVRALERRGFRLVDARALEVYGYTGERVTVHYADKVKSLEIWELDPSLERVLCARFPWAEIAIVDSHEEIRRTSKQYELIVVDNPVWPQEHFELFPAVLDRLSANAVLWLFVIPGANAVTRLVYPVIFSQDHLSRRGRFYDTDYPDDLSLDELITHYKKLCSTAGLDVEWVFAVRRWLLQAGLPRATTTYDLALKVVRT